MELQKGDRTMKIGNIDWAKLELLFCEKLDELISLKEWGKAETLCYDAERVLASSPVNSAGWETSCRPSLSVAIHTAYGKIEILKYQDKYDIDVLSDDDDDDDDVWDAMRRVCKALCQVVGANTNVDEE